MKGLREFPRCYAALVSDAALAAAVLGFWPVFAIGSRVQIPLGIWLLFLAAQLCVNLVLLERGCSLNGYLIWNGILILGAAYGIAGRAFCVPEDSGFPFLTGFLVLGTACHGAAAAWYLPQDNGLLRYVDVLIAVTAFYLYAAYQLDFPSGEYSLVLGAACGAAVLDLLAVSRLRTQGDEAAVIRGSGAGGKLILALVALGIVLATALLMGAASGQVHSLVDAALVVLSFVGKILGAVGNGILFVLGGIVLFFIWLFPSTPDGVKDQLQETVTAQAEEVIAETGLVLPAWLWWTICALVLAACFMWILKQLKGVRIRRIRQTGSRRNVVRKNHAWSALKALLKRLWEAARFEYQYRTHKNTPEGLLIYAERLGQRRRLGRQKAESPGEYLRRLAEQSGAAGRRADAGTSREEKDRGVRGDSSAAFHGEEKALRSLAELLDRACYGVRPELTGEMCREYRAALRIFLAKGQGRLYNKDTRF